MLKQIHATFVVAAIAFASSAAFAAQILSEEPHTGMLRAGQTALVDNGKCPAGQVMEVTAGDNGQTGNGVVKRKRRCIPRPS